MTDKHLTQKRFAEFDLPPQVLQAIEQAGFLYCTPIQAMSLPLALAGRDVMGQAQTGTGKTAAYLIALVNRLLRHPAHAQRRADQPRALVMAPTRELAIQIYNDALELTKFSGLRVLVVYGGMGYETQRDSIREGTDVLIGTPGRLIDYHKQRLFDLKETEVVVLDEADRMFDLGFIRDVRYLLRRMSPPERRLNMLFSATISLRVTELAYEHMNNPELVRIETDRVTAENIHQSVYYVSNAEKIPLLLGLLNKIRPRRAIVFVNTKEAGREVGAYLESNGINAGILSGDVPQKKRLSLLSGFHSGGISVLVATDVAARGLHIPDVTHVFNFDLPQDPEDYVHRIGRTARAGAAGDAISFACEDYAFSLPEIEDYIGHKLPQATVSEDLLVTPQPAAATERPARRRRGRSGGGSGASRASRSGNRRHRGRA